MRGAGGACGASSDENDELGVILHADTPTHSTATVRRTVLALLFHHTALLMQY
jgi:hypothetical protein